MQIITIIELYKSPYTTCYINEEGVLLPSKYLKPIIGLRDGSGDRKTEEDETILETAPISNQKSLKFNTTSLFLQPFLKACYNSRVYRQNVFKHLSELSGNSGTVILKLKLEPPDKEIIDYAWNGRIMHLVWSRIEIENAFAWLSTLGGAYSALGDYFIHCAEEAGRISLRQYRLSKMLGDDSLCARSRLYLALSHSQKGNLKLARHIVRQVNSFASKTKDVRLNRMCQGVWAKLKYLRQLNKSCSTNVNGTRDCVSNVTDVKV